jgi:hypothetical protein
VDVVGVFRGIIIGLVLAVGVATQVQNARRRS